jgi:spheroidene monooxygenase
MAAARTALGRDRRALFWKLCGSGTGEGFTPRPNWGVWAILAAWPDLATARAEIGGGPVWSRWRQRANADMTLYLAPFSSRGSWSGVNPFLPDPQTDGGASDAPLAALTRASLRPSRALRFWARVPGISSVIGADPNVAFKIGIGEVPLLHQVTFSVWPDAASMAAFARGSGPHAQAIRAVREDGWFAEELYARFRILARDGDWPGSAALDALCPTAATGTRAA